MFASDHAVTVDDILSIEDDAAFASVVCHDTEILAWPSVRNEFLRLIAGDSLYPTTPLVDLAPQRPMVPIIFGAARSAIHNFLHRASPSEVLIVGTGAGLLARHGRAFNRYTDYFADALPSSSWTMEGLSGGAWPRLPRSNPRLGFIADRRIWRELEGHLTVKSSHRRMIAELIDHAAKRAQNQLGWRIGGSRRETLITLGARRMATYPSEARFVSRLLARIRPRIALVEEGCYGRMAVFNATARRAGVTVAEFQHGMITRGHDAYNAAPRLISTEQYRLTQPAALLAYGQWWANQFNAPIDRVIVGNPHRSHVLQSWSVQPNRNLVLVLGDGTETDAHLRLCSELAKVLPPSMRVAFRPHPRERGRVPNGRSALLVDTEPDMYVTFARATAVIAEASTGLFEAIGLVPNVFAWDTRKSKFYLGDHALDRFETPADAVALLKRGPELRNQDGEEAYWAGNWQDRFMDFIARHA